MNIKVFIHYDPETNSRFESKTDSFAILNKQNEQLHSRIPVLISETLALANRNSLKSCQKEIMPHNSLSDCRICESMAGIAIIFKRELMNYYSYRKTNRSSRPVRYMEKKQEHKPRYLEKVPQKSQEAASQTVEIGTQKPLARLLSYSQKQLRPTQAFQLSKCSSGIFPQAILFSDSESSQNSENSFGEAIESKEELEESTDKNSSYRWIIELLNDD